MADVSLTEEDLEAIAVLYGGVKALHGVLPPDEDERLTATFDGAVSDALRGLSERIARDEDTHLRQAAILSTKYELADICLAQLIAYAGAAAPGIADVAARIRAISNSVVAEFPRVCSGLAARATAEAASLQAAVTKAQAECRAVLDAAETLEGEVANGEAERAALRDEADDLRGEIEGLRDELHEARGAAGGEQQEGDAEALRARLAQLEGALRGQQQEHDAAQADWADQMRATEAAHSQALAEARAAAAAAGGAPRPGGGSAPPSQQALLLQAAAAPAPAPYTRGPPEPYTPSEDPPAFGDTGAPALHQQQQQQSQQAPPRGAQRPAGRGGMHQTAAAVAAAAAAAGGGPPPSYMAATAAWKQRETVRGAALAGHVQQQPAAPPAPLPAAAAMSTAMHPAHHASQQQPFPQPFVHAAPPPPPQPHVAFHQQQAQQQQQLYANAMPPLAIASVPPAAHQAAPPAAAADAAPPPRAPLTLKQLHETMDAVWASKGRFDAKCAAARLPRETLEQHVYTFLNTKYGLRPLILEAAGSIIKAVNRWAPVDNDVAVFGRVLRSEVDEEYVQVTRQLRETATELLRVQLKQAHPGRADTAVAALLAERMGGGPGGGVSEAEWTAIVEYLYAPGDARAVAMLLWEPIARQAVAAAYPAPGAAAAGGSSDAAGGGPASPRTGSGGGSSAEEERVSALMRALPLGDIQALAGRLNPTGRLPWATFMQVVLDFQLRGHERFLARFRRAFRRVDTAGSGTVDRQGFVQVAAVIAPHRTPAALAALADAADPWGCDRVTFSDAVRVLSPDLAAAAAAAAAAGGREATSPLQQQQQAAPPPAPGFPWIVPAPPAVSLGSRGGGAPGPQVAPPPRRPAAASAAATAAAAAAASGDGRQVLRAKTGAIKW